MALKAKNVAGGTLRDEAAPERLGEYQALPAFALFAAFWDTPLTPIRSPSSGTSGTLRTVDRARSGNSSAARNTAVLLGLVGLTHFTLPPRRPKGGTDLRDNRQALEAAAMCLLAPVFSVSRRWSERAGDPSRH
jgi:hypothetical protein